VCDGIGEVIDGMIEVLAKAQVSEGRGEVGHRMAKAAVEKEVGEARGEVVHRSVEVVGAPKCLPVQEFYAKEASSLSPIRVMIFLVHRHILECIPKKEVGETRGKVVNREIVPFAKL
jgi:hypothetical protein